MDFWRINKTAPVIFLVIVLAACDMHLASEPPLHRAAYKGDVAEIKKLLQAGERVDGVNSEGATALHWAAFKGQADAAKLLLNYGANVNAQTKKGSTPLRLATTHKQEALVKLLESRGATVQ